MAVSAFKPAANGHAIRQLRQDERARRISLSLIRASFC
jgi:hypothetical protein